MTFRTLVLFAALTAAGPLAGEAAAQEPPPPEPPPAQQPPATEQPPPEEPEPVAGHLSLAVKAPFRDRRRKVALAGGRVRVRGTLSPWVPGQHVRVRVFRGKRKLYVKRLAVRQDGERGRYRLRLPVRWTGRLRVVAVHEPTAEMHRAERRRARLVSVRAIGRSGQRGVVVRLLQRQLVRLRYLGRRTGVYDGATERAVMAWRKVNGRRWTYSASAGVVRAILRGKGAYEPRHPRAGHHVEADLSRQVLALVDGDRVHRVYHTSSGAPATPTVVGRFRFYRKDPGTNAIGMVHSSYFIRGYAIHGYRSVPPWNASHGCLRVPIPDAWHIYSWIRIGDVIHVDR